MSDLETYLNFAKGLAQEAGKIITENFVTGISKEWKGDNTPVTIADTTINSMVIDAVSKKFPSHAVHGEEGDKAGSSEYQWVCDPVDGTTPYSHGVPITTFSLALTENGTPIVGVVYEPFTQRMFWATKNGGAYLNGAKMQVSKKTDLKNALMDIEGFPTSTKPVIQTDKDFVKLLNNEGVHTTALWSTILPSVLVAAGQFTAVIFNVSKPEDGAAVKLIVEEAGGKVTDMYGNEQRYDQPIKGYVASNGLVHDRIIQLIKQVTKQT